MKKWHRSQPSRGECEAAGRRNYPEAVPGGKGGTESSAVDGFKRKSVTALEPPIWWRQLCPGVRLPPNKLPGSGPPNELAVLDDCTAARKRSEERRVGKEC